MGARHLSTLMVTVTSLNIFEALEILGVLSEQVCEELPTSVIPMQSFQIAGSPLKGRFFAITVKWEPTFLSHNPVSEE